MALADLFSTDFSGGKVIPHYMVPGIRRYVLFGLRPGSFLEAIFSNDLEGAAIRADDTNELLILKYVSLVRGLPYGCHGSKASFHQWIDRKGLCGGAHLEPWTVEAVEAFQRFHADDIVDVKANVA